MRLFPKVKATALTTSRHREEILKEIPIDEEAVKTVKYLHEFDRLIQCPTWGYPSENAYYRDASSVDAIFDIRIPCLILQAEDDPIVGMTAVPYEEVQFTPYLTICSTSMGGHLGWYETGGGRWHAKPVFNFLDKMVREVDGKATKKHAHANDASKLAKRKYRGPFDFEPMRRKMYLPEVPN